MRALRRTAVVLLLALTATAQSRSQQPPRTKTIPGGSAVLIDAELTTPLDTRAAHPGDQVSAVPRADVRYLDARDLIKSIEGHVVGVTRKDTHNAQTSIGVVFDRVLLKNGRTLALHGTVLRVEPPIRREGDAIYMRPWDGSISAGDLSRWNSAVTRTVSDEQMRPHEAGETDASGDYMWSTPKQHRAVGTGVEVRTAAKPTGASVIFSKSNNFRLPPRALLLLRLAATEQK